MQTYGPVTAAIDAYTDFCWPTDPPVYSANWVRSDKNFFLSPGTSNRKAFPLDAQDRGDPGDPNDLNDAIVITGYTDE